MSNRLCDNHPYQEIAACLEQLVYLVEQDRQDATAEARAALAAVGTELPPPRAKRVNNVDKFPCNLCGSQGKRHAPKCLRSTSKSKPKP